MERSGGLSGVENERHHYRIPCKIAVHIIDIHGMKTVGEICDLTTNGACIRSNYPLRTKGLCVNLHFVANGVEVNVVGRVTGVYPGSRFGVQFIKIDPVYKLQIAAYLYMRMQVMGFRPPS